MCAKKTAGNKKKVLFTDDFYTDMSVNDMLHAVIVRSPFSSGKIQSIDFPPKIKVPEDCRLFTYKDFPGNKRIKLLGTEFPLISEGEIAYKGEILAVITGKDLNILNELSKSIRIKLDKRKLQEKEDKFSKAYNYLSVSLKDGSPIEESIISLRNTLLDFPNPKEVIARRKFSVGNVDEIFDDGEKAHYIIEGKWKNKICYHSDKESEGCLCLYKNGNLHIYTASQWISGLKKIVSESLNLEKEKITITRTKISVKTSSSLIQNGILSAIASMASMKTGKAVRISLSRKEHENFLENAPEVKIHHKTAIDKNGIFTAMDISLEFDAGYDNPFAQELLDRLSIALPGIYNCKNVRINGKALKSHNPPVSFQLSMIDSYSFFAMENQVQKISEITGFSPIDLRQMNKAGGLQKHPLPFAYTFGRSSDAINAVAIRSDFKRKYSVYRMAGHRRFEGAENNSYAPPLRGIAIACAFDGSGYMGPNFENSNISMQISVTEDKKIIVDAYPPSNSIKEIWSRLITENLDIDKRNIVFTNEITDDLGRSKNEGLMIPDTLVGTISIKTILLKKCIDSIKKKNLKTAPFTVKKTLGTGKKKLWNQEEFSGTPYYNTAFGTCTVELELDSCTYKERIQKICVIIDGGKILHPKAAENSIYRSIQRCLSMLVENESQNCPSISVQFTQSEEEPKQIGHLIYSILPAAFSSALSQALSSSVQNLPLKTDSIYKIMEAKE